MSPRDALLKITSLGSEEGPLALLPSPHPVSLLSPSKCPVDPRSTGRLPLKRFATEDAFSGICLWPTAVVIYSQNPAPGKGDPVSLNSCAPVCVNVLANPVTNSLCYKAATSGLPGQGWIPTGVVC